MRRLEYMSGVHLGLWLVLSMSMLQPDLPAAVSSQPNARPDAAFTDFFRRTNGWTAGDGAISIPLSDGRVLWLFGDSHLDDLDPKTGTMPCLFQCRNAGLLQNTN